MGYSYTQYFHYADLYNDTISNGGQPCQLPKEYLEFKQHITEINALDLTDAQIRDQIPRDYWKTATEYDMQIFPQDLHYIKNSLYKDSVFKLMQPFIENDAGTNEYVLQKLIVFHENLYNAPGIPKNFRNILWIYLGDLYSDLRTETLTQERPRIQQWFDTVKFR